MDIHTIKSSITEIPYEKALERVLAIRQSRREVPERKKSNTKKSSKPKKTNNKAEIKSVLKGLTSEEREKMIALMSRQLSEDNND